MSLGHGASIVRDGLVLHLDAANIKSYSGFTAWNDLSGNNNNGTLINGVGYSFANQGYFIFDGNDDYVDLGTITSSSKLMLNNPANGGVSISFAVQWNGTGDSYQRIIDKSTTGSGTNGYCIWIEPTGTATPERTMVFRVAGSATPNSTVESNTIMPIGQNCIWTVTHDQATGAAAWYFNGELDSSTTQPYSIPNFEVGLTVGSWPGRTAREFNGKIGYISIYDKALTAEEVHQNFEATRGRYGI